jgi:uncharacterized protein YdeI (YjbR/CyaY-like superfamily)
MKIRFFRSPAELRQWFEANHATEVELWVGYYKKDTGKPSITWPESVDQALCFGWIDGIRKRIDEISYMIRFTPRKPRSIWSAVNIRRAGELIKLDLMHPRGLAAYEAREENRSGIYSYEQRSAELPDQYAKQLQKNKNAWKFYQTQPASYRKAVNWWILCAKTEETRLRRLGMLIADSENGRTLAQYTRYQKPKKKVNERGAP